jgi:hypothetical protein
MFGCVFVCNQDSHPSRTNLIDQPQVIYNPKTSLQPIMGANDDIHQQLPSVVPDLCDIASSWVKH